MANFNYKAYCVSKHHADTESFKHETKDCRKYGDHDVHMKCPGKVQAHKPSWTSLGHARELPDGTMAIGNTYARDVKCEDVKVYVETQLPKHHACMSVVQLSTIPGSGT